MTNHMYKKSTARALSFMITPVIFLLSAGYLFSLPGNIAYWGGSLLLSCFFTQTFILLHECGHMNFFDSAATNTALGHLFGFLSGIPFHTWKHMHNLHHKWTGWRDLDPTTERTVDISGAPLMKLIANICWFFFIPIFYFVYLVSNYWNLKKIHRFVPEHVYRASVAHIVLYLSLYAVVGYLFADIVITYILPALVLSFVWKELLILTQHSHIDIPLSEGKPVKPIPYSEQVEYTRSFYTFSFLEKYFLFNFNFHKAHHANPGIPAYWLNAVENQQPKEPTFLHWFVKAKSMKGEDYIFRTSKHTGKKF